MSGRILIVDDSAIIRHSLRACIENNTDWEVCGEAENGEVAVEKVRQLHPDVVTLDWQMPVMNGFDAAAEIRRLPDAKKASTPIIALTASATSDVRDKVLASGMQDYITKPFNPDELIVKLKRYVS